MPETRMILCPKCGSCNINGPHYRDAGWKVGYGECLSYRCCRCGYERDYPCKDHEDEDEDEGASP